jgi:plastocyanin
MNIITGIVIIARVIIASFAGLVITDKISISSLFSQGNSDKVQKLEAELQQANARIDVLYGKPPQPIATNQITLPLYTSDYAQNCNIRYNCVEPYSIVAYVGDTITWTNNDQNGHSIESASNYAQNKCNVMGGAINMILNNGQSSSMKFTKAGQYDYCVSGYNGEVHGVVIIKDKSGLT